MFCPTCKGLLRSRLVRGRPVGYCPRCDGKGSDTAPLAWFTKPGGGPDRASEAARVAATARPQVAASEKRAKVREAPRQATQAPAGPDKIEVPDGLDLFPFTQVRDGQREFIADVAQAAEQKRHLLAHAPTGLGKTVSTLAPLVAYALKHEMRVLFLTSKQSQHKIALDTLKAVRKKAGVPFVVADVISKQDMCPRREARDMFGKRFSEFCRREQVAGSCEYWETPNASAIKLLKQRPHHVEELVITATDCNTCPHQAAIDLAAQAHIVVCDYNYLFSDMRANVQERLKLDLSKVLLVVDEAHNLPDRIRDHLTLKLDEYVLDDALEEAKDLEDDALRRRIEALHLLLAEMADVEPQRDPDEDRVSMGERLVSRDEFTQAVDEALSKKATSITPVDYEKLLDHLQKAAAEYEKRLKQESEGLAKLGDFLANWKIERRGLARILTREPSASLAYKMLDPSILSKPVFDAVHASVVMSGTLHPMEMIRDVLGLDAARTTLREYESPFPPENRLALVDSSVTTGYKERTPQMFADIGERLAEIALATPGNVAAFFPSYKILEDVRHHVERALRGRKDLIVEERGLDKAEKEALVQQMRRGLDNARSGSEGGALPGHGGALLLGVMGGSLSEGYDYADNLLKGVAIVGLPFAAPSLEVEALIGYYDKKFGPGKGRPYAYVYPTFHRVMQAVGRCIRGPDDRGVIVLLDKRFGWGSYQSAFPRDLRPRATDDPVAKTREFWASKKR